MWSELALHAIITQLFLGFIGHRKTGKPRFFFKKNCLCGSSSTLFQGDSNDPQMFLKKGNDGIDSR